MTAYRWHLAARRHSTLIYLVCDDCGYEAAAHATWTADTLHDFTEIQELMPDHRHLLCHADWSSENLAPADSPRSDAETVGGERGTANDTLPPASHRPATIALDIADPFQPLRMTPEREAALSAARERPEFQRYLDASQEVQS